MHPKWRCVFHIQPEREPCSGEGHDHHGKKRRTIGWVCKSIAEATNLAFGCNLKESARTEQVAFAATRATAFYASDDRRLWSIFHSPATRVGHPGSGGAVTPLHGVSAYGARNTDGAGKCLVVIWASTMFVCGPRGAEIFSFVADGSALKRPSSSPRRQNRRVFSFPPSWFAI